MLPMIAFVLLSITVLLAEQSYAASNDGIDGRYSFSLTTFDPAGKLGQVERASIAASLGTPIVALRMEDSIIMMAPQILPSPFMLDDGTSRFASITPSIFVAHSGISGDGRVLVAAAQRLAVEHAYTFDEPIPMELFLEEMSLLFQEYTMKPAARPFGVTLIVGEVPTEKSGQSPRSFRIDPSGAVTRLKAVSVINGDYLKLKNKIEDTKSLLANAESADSDELTRRMQSILSKALHDSQPKQPAEEDTWNILDNSSIICAHLGPSQRLQIKRVPLDAVGDEELVE